MAGKSEMDKKGFVVAGHSVVRVSSKAEEEFDQVAMSPIVEVTFYDKEQINIEFWPDTRGSFFVGGLYFWLDMVLALYEAIGLDCIPDSIVEDITQQVCEDREREQLLKHGKKKWNLIRKSEYPPRPLPLME